MKIFVLLILCWGLVAEVRPSLYAQTGSTVIVDSFYSEVLGVSKKYSIYLPPGYESSNKQYPVVYFLRLHESEWFDAQIPGRNGRGLKEVADALIEQGLTGEMILVGPSTGSDDGSVAGMMNMLQPERTNVAGIGSGRFEDYFVQDLIPEIERKYRILDGPAFRGIDGFSFGGYTAMVLTFRNPGLFRSVGSYDGTHMWYDLEDPAVTVDGPNDLFWLDSTYDALVGPLFGVPRDVDYMLQHSAINQLLAADEAKLDSLRAIRFHIHTGDDDALTNMRRTNQLVDSMAVRGIVNSFASTVLYPGALHDYAFANFHATKSLVKHWETFQAAHPVGVVEYGDLPGSSLTAFPNPFRQTVTLHYSVGRAGWITLKIYDSLGREVWQVSSIRERGAWQVVWDGRDTVGREVPSGVYYGVLTAGADRHMAPVVLRR